MQLSNSSAAKVVVTHAYSRRNSGDGLLVDLTLSVVREAVGGDAQITVLALDAESFDSPQVISWTGPGSFRGSSRLSHTLRAVSALLFGPSKAIKRRLDEADLVVAVGGGYLRGSSCMELLKNLVAHWPQLRMSKRYGKKTVYLPQSVGPLPWGQRALYRSALKRVATVSLRDDRSVTELQGLTNISRVPDLAVLGVSTLDTSAFGADVRGVVFVARDLTNPRQYGDFLAEAAHRPGARWAIQSLGRGNDDETITRKYSTHQPVLVRDVLKESPSLVVVSTRLHGSLDALLHGHPTVHLSYERKGWGAFEDLGVPFFVLNARDARYEEVDDRILEITRNPSAYWDAIAQQIPSLNSRRQLMIQNLAKISGRERIVE